jgi:hypothetical protein
MWLTKNSSVVARVKLVTLTIRLVHAGKMEDKSTGDVAADGYHKYMVNNMGAEKSSAFICF